MTPRFYVFAKSHTQFIGHPVLADDVWTDHECKALDFGTAADALAYIFETAAYLLDGRKEFEVVEEIELDDGTRASRFLDSEEIDALT